MTMQSDIDPADILSKAIQTAIKEYVKADQVQSGNHCLRCALDRAHDHLEAVLATTATMLELSGHNHRVGKKSSPTASAHQG